MKFSIVICQSLLFLTILSTVAQTSEQIFLKQGYPVISEITPHKPGVYFLNLKKDQFASIRVTQKEVGLVVLGTTRLTA